MAMPYKNQMNQYKRMKIETASPEMLILMLYDGAIKNIRIAITNMEASEEEKDLEAINNCLIKAQNIITELMVSLNFEIGGDIARNLFNIYEFVNYTLAQANVKKTPDNLHTVTTMLSDLRETWKEVIRINKEKYPNGIPRPATSESSDEADPLDIAPAEPPPTPIADESPTTQVANSTPPEEPKTEESASPPPSSNPSPQVSRQTNRFKQIYGKNIPRKV